jgi:hypothetical protein
MVDSTRTTRTNLPPPEAAPTAAILYFYTSVVPASVTIAREIDADPTLSEFITTQDIDSPVVRRTLLHNPTITIEEVPIFFLQLPNSPPELVKASERQKVYSIIQGWRVDEGLTIKEKGKEKEVVETK